MAHKILAVDDHPETLDIIVATLKGNGYRVVSTQQPLQALSLALKEKPDLMIVDKNMPGLNGDEVVLQIRAEAEFSKTPIIMFTAENDVINKVNSFDAGADDYLTKPTNPIELIERIQTLLASIEPRVSEPLADEPEEAEEEMPSELDDILAQLDLLDNAASAEAPPEEEAAKGEITTVIGARGGVGTTTVAINLALMLSQQNQSTLLTDLDFTNGHIAHYFGKRFPVGLSDLTGLHPETFDQQLEQIILPLSSHLHLLMTKANPLWQGNCLNEHELKQLQHHSQKQYAQTVCDLGSTVSNSLAPFWQEATRIVIVTKPEKISLLSTRTLLRELQQFVSSSMIHVALLNTQDKASLPQNSIESFLRHQVSAVFNLQISELALATNKNKPLLMLQPNGRFAQKMKQFAEMMVA